MAGPGRQVGSAEQLALRPRPRRGLGWTGGGQPQVLEDLADHLAILDEGDDLEPPLATLTAQSAWPVGALPDTSCPVRAAISRRRAIPWIPCLSTSVPVYRKGAPSSWLRTREASVSSPDSKAQSGFMEERVPDFVRRPPGCEPST